VTQEPGATFEATYESGSTGLVGALAVKIDDNTPTTVLGPQTTQIVEIGVTGVYSAILVAPSDEGQYSIVWSNDGSFIANHGIGEEDLLVAASILGLSPLPPLTDFGPGTTPPCSAWTTRAGVASCCAGFADDTTDAQDAAIRAATEILYEVSNGLYPGECGPVTVRPCNQACSCWGPWSYGLGYSWDPTRSLWACDAKACGCSPTSDVVLSGVPIREIVEVTIDGVALDADEYNLMEPNRLVRLRDITAPHVRLVWPGCQAMDLPDTEEGTFSVTYTYGADPPQAGRSAAAALACEIWQACSPAGECALPENVTRTIREGITIESAPFAASSLKAGATGIAAIDSFVGLFGGAGTGRSSVWSPDLEYPRRFRSATGT
jgi:hypothetical protein